ncbi:MAG: response regulator [Desulfobacterales bacterium]|nr:response regulator [Desulfobacterales bacterium]
MDNFRVLIVDDEDDFRESLVNRFAKRGLSVTGVESGEEALKILGEKLFDVVILDVKMPGMDGIETLRKMKMMKPLMEVIMLTGHATIESGVEGMKLGACEYVVKPADINVMLDKMRKAYERKKAREEEIMQCKISELEAHPGRVFKQIKEKK